MEEFIVLGLVPGTSIQIDFFVWLKVATLCAGIMAVFIVHRRLQKRSYTFVPPVSESHQAIKVVAAESFDTDTNIET